MGLVIQNLVDGRSRYPSRNKKDVSLGSNNNYSCLYIPTGRQSRDLLAGGQRDVEDMGWGPRGCASGRAGHSQDMLLSSEGPAVVRECASSESRRE